MVTEENKELAFDIETRGPLMVTVIQLDNSRKSTIQVLE